jgi:YHS domain-containing protein
MIVDEKTAKHVSESEGERVYLCSAASKSQFDATEKNDSSSSSSNCCCRYNLNRYTATESLQSMAH